MTKFTYNNPSEFSDEDKWFRYFTKKDLAVIIVTGGITILLYKSTTALFNKPFLGLIFGGIIMLISVSVSMIKLPETLYLTGGGQTIATILIRRYIRHKKKVIYTKGYDVRRVV